MGTNKTPFMSLKPKDINNAAWRLVIESWENGLSDREAAFRASRRSCSYVSESHIKQWIKDNPAIGELKERLQSDLLSEAKLTISDSIRHGDVRTAKWYLERKAANEFSTKAAIAFEGAAVELTLEEKERKMQEFMEGFGGENG